MPLKENSLIESVVMWGGHRGHMPMRADDGDKAPHISADQLLRSILQEIDKAGGIQRVDLRGSLARNQEIAQTRVWPLFQKVAALRYDGT